ncbi:uncharacterized protein LOC144461802 [Epinephelus lanceolatus]
MEEPTPLHTKVASILGPASMSGVVSEREGDTDFAQEESVTLQVVAVGEEEEEQVVEEIPSTSGTDPSVPSAPSGSRVRGGGRVLTDRVLETQRETISAIREVRDELTQIRMVMQNMCELISSATDAIKQLQK